MAFSFAMLLLLLLLFVVFTVILGVSVDAEVFQILLSIFANDRKDSRIIKVESDSDKDINKNGDECLIKIF